MNAATAKDLEFTEVELAPVLAAQLHGQCAPDPASISKAMETSFGALMAFIGQASLTPVGAPRAIYTSYGAEGVGFTVATPVAGPPANPVPDGAGFVAEIAGGKALRFTHSGPYSKLMLTYNEITSVLKSKGLMQTEADWAR